MKLHYVFFLSLMLLVGCSVTKKEKESRILRLNYLSDATSLDPRFGYEIPANHTVKMLFDGLMRYQPDGKLGFAACERYEISPDQKKYTFFLREAKWSNGAKLTAHDFEYAWKCVIDPKLPTLGAADFYPIKNVQAVVRGKLPLEEVKIQALDQKTLVVELENPTPYFLELIATSAFSPIYSANKPGIKEECWISNGPFCLKEWVPTDKIVLEKNPHYWNKEGVKFDKIEISIIPDASTQLAMYEKKKIDWFGKPFSKLPLDAVPSLREKGQLTFVPERAVYWYFLNTEKFPFTHPKIRKAFSLAIDRREIVSHVLKEEEVAATSLNRGSSYFSDGDVKTAMALFSEALAELQMSKEEFPSVKLSYCNLETNHRVASCVQQMWQNVLGITVELDPQEWTCYYDNLCTGNFVAGGMSWHSRIKDPIYNLQLFQYKEDRLNMSNWENIRFQQLISKAQEKADPKARASLLVEAESSSWKKCP